MLTRNTRRYVEHLFINHDNPMIMTLNDDVFTICSFPGALDLFVEKTKGIEIKFYVDPWAFLDPVFMPVAILLCKKLMGSIEQGGLIRIYCSELDVNVLDNMFGFCNRVNLKCIHATQSRAIRDSMIRNWQKVDWDFKEPGAHICNMCVPLGSFRVLMEDIYEARDDMSNLLVFCGHHWFHDKDGDGAIRWRIWSFLANLSYA